MSFTAYWNGEWVPSEEIRIDPLDRGFMVADATFEATRTFNGRIYHLDDHIRRLYRSLDYIRLDPGLTQEEMAALTEEAVERNLDKLDAAGDLHIHHFVTRGKGRRAWSADGAQVGIRVSGLDFAGYYDRLRRSEGRDNPNAVVPRGGPRPQDQALQPHELQPRRA